MKEKLTDIPEDRDLAGEWLDQKQSRTFDELCGSGGVTGRPTTICERNLIGINDPYRGRASILIHEFAHTIQNQGLDPTNSTLINNEFTRAQSANIFRTANGNVSYMMTNSHEFFAEATATWFRATDPSNPAISPEQIDRAHLAYYAPKLYSLLSAIYPNDSWEYPRPE
jgi:hypothetical protein